MEVSPVPSKWTSFIFWSKIRGSTGICVPTPPYAVAQILALLRYSRFKNIFERRRKKIWNGTKKNMFCPDNIRQRISTRSPTTPLFGGGGEIFMEIWLSIFYQQEGNSALAWSAKHGHEDIVQRLLARGAYFNLPDKVGRLVPLKTWRKHVFFSVVYNTSGTERLST